MALTLAKPAQQLVDAVNSRIWYMPVRDLADSAERETGILRDGVPLRPVLEEQVLHRLLDRQAVLNGFRQLHGRRVCHPNSDCVNLNSDL